MIIIGKRSLWRRLTLKIFCRFIAANNYTTIQGHISEPNSNMNNADLQHGLDIFIVTAVKYTITILRIGIKNV